MKAPSPETGTRTLHVPYIPLQTPFRNLLGSGVSVAGNESLDLTLLMAETKAMVLVVGFGFPFAAGLQQKSGFKFGKRGFSFGFQF